MALELAEACRLELVHSDVKMVNIQRRSSAEVWVVDRPVKLLVGFDRLIRVSEQDSVAMLAGMVVEEESLAGCGKHMRVAPDTLALEENTAIAVGAAAVVGGKNGMPVAHIAVVGEFEELDLTDFGDFDMHRCLYVEIEIQWKFAALVAGQPSEHLSPQPLPCSGPF